jgi:hypothetical protein
MSWRERRRREKRPEKNKQRPGREQASRKSEKLERRPAPTPMVVKNEIVFAHGEGKLPAHRLVALVRKSQ